MYLKNVIVGIDAFIEATSYFVKVCSYFSFENEFIDKSKEWKTHCHKYQKLSQVSEAPINLKKGEISFLCKYVDDIFTAVDNDSANVLQEQIN